jgi:hypothetical protein
MECFRPGRIRIGRTALGINLTSRVYIEDHLGALGESPILPVKARPKIPPFLLMIV